MYPAEVSWSFCGMKGAAPYTFDFCVSNGRCSAQCNDATVDFRMADAYGDGWGYNYYQVLTSDGDIRYGGSLQSAEETHRWCLAEGTYMLAVSEASYASEVSWELCGVSGGAPAALMFQIDSHGKCTVPQPATDCAQNAVSFNMLSSSGDGWGAGAQYQLSLDGTAVSAGTLESGAFGQQQLCLTDGCYDFSTVGGQSVVWNAMHEHKGVVKSCGRFGGAPVSSQLCVEKDFGFCYFTDCPVVKSYVEASARQEIIIANATTSSLKLIDLESTVANAHGVTAQCLSKGCYKALFGGGIRTTDYKNDEAGWEFCGQSGSFPAEVDYCMGADGRCSVSNVVEYSSSCTGQNEQALMMMMIDLNGKGWAGTRFAIKAGDGTTIADGTLSRGAVGAANVCLQRGLRYTLTVGRSSGSAELLWYWCGQFGGASTSATFDVSETGDCLFTSGEPEYFAEDDDDFPIAGPDYTPAPPGPSPAPVPTPAPTPAIVPVELLKLSGSVSISVDATIGDEDRVETAELVRRAVGYILVKEDIPVYDVTVTPDDAGSSSSSSSPQLLASILLQRQLNERLASVDGYSPAAGSSDEEFSAVLRRLQRQRAQYRHRALPAARHKQEPTRDDLDFVFQLDVLRVVGNETSSPQDTLDAVGTILGAAVNSGDMSRILQSEAKRKKLYQLGKVEADEVAMSSSVTTTPLDPLSEDQLQAGKYGRHQDFELDAEDDGDGGEDVAADDDEGFFTPATITIVVVVSIIVVFGVMGAAVYVLRPRGGFQVLGTRDGADAALQERVLPQDVRSDDVGDHAAGAVELPNVPAASRKVRFATRGKRKGRSGPRYHALGEEDEGDDADELEGQSGAIEVGNRDIGERGEGGADDDEEVVVPFHTQLSQPESAAARIGGSEERDGHDGEDGDDA
jgi:hypothetical protein